MNNIGEHTEPILFLLTCALFSSLAVYNLLIHPGIIGHNWDAPIPGPDWYLRDIFFDSFCSWEKHYLGHPMAMKLTTIFPVLLYSSFGLIGLPGQIASKALLLALLILSMLSMGHLTNWLLNFCRSSCTPYHRFLLKLIASTAYVMSPFVFNVVIGGAFVQYCTLALLPLLVKYSILVASQNFKKSKKDAAILAILFSLILSSAQNFALLWLIFFLFCMIYNPAESLKGFALTFILTLLLTSYALLPLLYVQNGLGREINHMNFSAQFKQIINTSPAFFNTIFGAGYNNRHFFLTAFPYPPLFYISSALLLGIILYCYGLDISARKSTLSNAITAPGNVKDKIEFFLFFFFLLSTAIAACGKGPFAWFMLWGYKHLPLMHLFRSTQRLMILPSLFFPLVLVCSLSRIHHKQPLFLIGILALLLVRALPFWSGDFGRARLANTGLGVMDNYQIPPDYLICLKAVDQDQTWTRTLFLPISISPYYLQNKYQIEAQGGDPLVQSSPQPAVFAFPFYSAYPLINRLTKRIYKLDKPCLALDQLCTLFSSKYVLLRKDVWDHGPYRNLWINNCRLLENILENCGNLQQIYQGQYCSLFRAKKFIPMLSCPQGKIYVWNHRNF